MFRRKKDLRIPELSPVEKRLLVRAMLYFRNKLLETGRPSENVKFIVI